MSIEIGISSTHVGTRLAAMAQNFPFSLFCWVKPVGVLPTNGSIRLLRVHADYTTVPADNYSELMVAASFNPYIRWEIATFSANNAPVSVGQTEHPNLFNDMWIPFLGVFALGSSRTAYALNSTGTVLTLENTSNRTPGVMNDIVLGGDGLSIPIRIARPTVWANRSITALEFDDLVAGLDPAELHPTYVAMSLDTEKDWGGSPIDDLSGNGNTISSGTGWTFSSDSPPITASGGPTHPFTSVTIS